MRWRRNCRAVGEAIGLEALGPLADGRDCEAGELREVRCRGSRRTHRSVVLPAVQIIFAGELRGKPERTQTQPGGQRNDLEADRASGSTCGESRKSPDPVEDVT